MPQRTQTVPAAAPSLGLTDAFRTVHPQADRVGTYHDFSGRRSGPKVDYIFVTPDVTIRDADILHDNRNGQYPSDHFPVTAILRLPGSAQPQSTTQRLDGSGGASRAPSDVGV
jgi:endonuclease/exonuclease/phosphatase family metal-dependent hydrolase